MKCRFYFYGREGFSEQWMAYYRSLGDGTGDPIDVHFVGLS